ncbi:hypothetical protein CLTHE_27560 [Clostridium thermobutyricum DSM 4928]|uniref:Uncharacterized protein n=1 Tax=Clostridium thermobutyricum DSM 4928 TaxID=1121339 RepID=A0A1V4SSW1_9CLOT|nr:hypothetical protein CLTHE_27560 [Clostridium thermobutyricum DSM 4928]
MIEKKNVLLPMRFDPKYNVDEISFPYCEVNLLYGEEKK